MKISIQNMYSKVKSGCVALQANAATDCIPYTVRTLYTTLYCTVYNVRRTLYV